MVLVRLQCNVGWEYNQYTKTNHSFIDQNIFSFQLLNVLEMFIRDFAGIIILHQNRIKDNYITKYNNKFMVRLLPHTEIAYVPFEHSRKMQFCQRQYDIY